MTDRERIADLLLRWEELFEDGEDVPPEELCREAPQLLEPLRAQIHALASVSSILKGAAEDTVCPQATPSPKPGPLTESLDFLAPAQQPVHDQPPGQQLCCLT